MDKQNIFCSSQFHMDAGDVLHILVKDLIGTLPEISLTGENDILFDFLWTGDISGDYLISDTDGRKIEIIGKDFVSSYIPYTSTSTFKLIDNMDFIADDIDNLWFDGSGGQKSVTVADLINTDYSRTVIKFANSSPYHIYAIGILNSAIILTQAQINYLHSEFWLWLFWSGVFNDYGYLKDNRLIP
jgi:hypothetical protein